MEVKILLEKQRGKLVESRHRGYVAVVDENEKNAYYVSSSNVTTYWRSSAKPFQAIPLIQDGGINKFGLTLKELALICASHAGEQQHVNTVSAILSKVGVTEKHLQCGIHPPVNRTMRENLIRSRTSPSEVHNNCSGKHAGMLALAKLMGVSTEGYWKLEHPVQKRMLETVKIFTGLNADEIKVGIDGCGVPVYGVSLSRMALAYKRLVSNNFSGGLAKACKVILKAMMFYPNMISGKGRFNTVLMETLQGRIAAKGGAQGVFCMAVPERKLGIAIKIEDGDGKAVPPVAVEVLKQLKILNSEETKKLKEFHKPVIKNARGETCGEIKPVFKLTEVNR